jgi:ABC-type nitrate/sulfonate/bicarbonate transport system substrate-binding protein
MEKIKIIGVPEHFNYPWVRIVEEQPFREEDIVLEWMNEPRGSGAMNKTIREEQADVAIILTESFIKDKVEGNPGQIIGLHVQSPLIWGIHISSKVTTKSMEELKHAPFVISRYGSGSHLMAFLLARKNGWDLDSLQFEVVGDLEGAKKALKSAVPKIFLWEKYMTKPLVDKGLFNRVGEIPTPWPCFVMVASKNALEKYPKQLRTLRDLVYQKSSSLSKEADFIRQLNDKYGINESDLKDWLAQTNWASKGEIETKALSETMETLKALKLITREMAVERLVNPEFVDLV